MEKLDEIKLTLAAVIGALTGFWGWMGWLVVGWMVCMVLDYLSGTAAAMKAGEWSSKLAREGIWHKLGMIFAVMVGAGADLLVRVVAHNLPLELPVEFKGLVCPVVLVFYIITELGSIAENAHLLGAVLPGWLQKSLKTSREMLENGEGVKGEQ